MQPAHDHTRRMNTRPPACSSFAYGRTDTGLVTFAQPDGSGAVKLETRDPAVSAMYVFTYPYAAGTFSAPTGAAAKMPFTLNVSAAGSTCVATPARPCNLVWSIRPSRTGKHLGTFTTIGTVQVYNASQIDTVSQLTVQAGVGGLTRVSHPAGGIISTLRRWLWCRRRCIVVSLSRAASVSAARPTLWLLSARIQWSSQVPMHERGERQRATRLRGRSPWHLGQRTARDWQRVAPVLPATPVRQADLNNGVQSVSVRLVVEDYYGVTYIASPGAFTVCGPAPLMPWRQCSRGCISPHECAATAIAPHNCCHVAHHLCAADCPYRSHGPCSPLQTRCRNQHSAAASRWWSVPTPTRPPARLVRSVH